MRFLALALTLLLAGCIHADNEKPITTDPAATGPPATGSSDTPDRQSERSSQETAATDQTVPWNASAIPFDWTATIGPMVFSQVNGQPYGAGFAWTAATALELPGDGPVNGSVLLTWDAVTDQAQFLELDLVPGCLGDGPCPDQVSAYGASPLRIDLNLTASSWLNVTVRVVMADVSGGVQVLAGAAYYQDVHLAGLALRPNGPIVEVLEVNYEGMEEAKAYVDCEEAGGAGTGFYLGTGWTVPEQLAGQSTHAAYFHVNAQPSLNDVMPCFRLRGPDDALVWSSDGPAHVLLRGPFPPGKYMLWASGQGLLVGGSIDAQVYVELD